MRNRISRIEKLEDRKERSPKMSEHSAEERKIVMEELALIFEQALIDMEGSGSEVSMSKSDTHRHETSPKTC